jgi:hypothetical protein
MSNLTSNVNLLSPIGFKLTIEGDFTNTEYFAVSANIPSVSLQEVSSSFRNRKGFEPGDTLNFEALSVKLMIDEDMVNYKELFDWIKLNTDAVKLKSADIILSIMSSDSVMNKQIRFVRAFPISIAGLDFNVQSTEIEYLQAEVSFKYDYFEFIS